MTGNFDPMVYRVLLLGNLCPDWLQSCFCCVGMRGLSCLRIKRGHLIFLKICATVTFHYQQERCGVFADGNAMAAKMSKGFTDSNQSWLKLMNADQLSSGSDDDNDEALVWRHQLIINLGVLDLIGCYLAVILFLLGVLIYIYIYIKIQAGS
jgi:hypothetical protein